MNRKMLVTLLRKNIDELILITEGFMEMKEYPTAIINLAKNKTDEIHSYIDQLKDIHSETTNANAGEVEADKLREEDREVEEEGREGEEVGGEKGNKAVSDEEVGKEVEEVTEDKVTEETVAIPEENIPSSEIEEPAEVKSQPEIQPKEESKEKIIEATEQTEKTEQTEQSEKKFTIAEKMAASGISRNELHARQEAGRVNGNIAGKKITDIRQAISLGDRFRFQRELFRNNGEEMNKMLSYINMLATYDEVVSFLQSKYGWEKDNPVVEDFYQIIKRKY